jgi:hypothetical protein
MDVTPFALLVPGADLRHPGTIVATLSSVPATEPAGTRLPRRPGHGKKSESQSETFTQLNRLDEVEQVPNTL